MGNYQAVLSLIEELEVRCWTTQVYIKITGSLDLGVFLERIVWWSDKTSRTDGYFWKKAEEWGDELCVSYDQIKRMEKKLKDLGFIETALKRANSAPTTHYKPVMKVILDSINTIFKKVENQESRKSGNPNLDFQESRKSDFQESRKSLTGKTQERQQEERESHTPPHEDYLASVVNGQGKVADNGKGIPEDQYFEYRDKFLTIQQEMTGKYPDQVFKDQIPELVKLGITPATWRQAWVESKLNWSGNGNVPFARVKEVAISGGTWENWKKSRFPDSGNGRDSPGSSPSTGLKITRSANGGYNV